MYSIVSIQRNFNVAFDFTAVKLYLKLFLCLKNNSEIEVFRIIENYRYLLSLNLKWRWKQKTVWSTTYALTRVFYHVKHNDKENDSAERFPKVVLWIVKRTRDRCIKRIIGGEVETYRFIVLIPDEEI